MLLGSLLRGQQQGVSRTVIMTKDFDGGMIVTLIINSDSLAISKYPRHTVLVDYVFNSLDSISVIVRTDDRFINHQFRNDGIHWIIVGARAWIGHVYNKYNVEGIRRSVVYKLIDFETVGFWEDDRLVPLPNVNK